VCWLSQLESTSLRTPEGTLHKDDLLAFTTADGFGIGFAKVFFLQKSDGTMYVFIARLSHNRGALFRSDSSLVKKCLVPVQNLRGAFPYLPQGNTILLIASVDSLG
jgi:hypothetical protein